MISIKREDIEIVLEHARDENPREACGILAGNNGIVEKVYRMKNKDLSSVTYLMDSMEQFAVMKEMRGKGLDIVGIYHSHTSSVAFPSATDIERAFYPEASYLIVSLAGKEPQMRSFRIKDEKIEEEEIGIL